MKDSNKAIYSIPLSGMDYYSRKSLQFNIASANKTITKITTLKHNDGITFLYFRNGHGRIIVNTKEYFVSRGCLMALSSYHYYQIIPDNDYLDIAECSLSYETFLYMAANPYYKLTEINQRIYPLMSYLKDDMIVRTESIIDNLVAETLKHKSFREDVAFFLIMRLMGIMQKTFSHDI